MKLEAVREHLGRIRKEMVGEQMVGSDSMELHDLLQAAVRGGDLTINPAGQAYVSALRSGEVDVYGEKGVTVQALYIYGNVRAKTPKGKALKKGLLDYGNGKISLADLKKKLGGLPEQARTGGVEVAPRYYDLLSRAIYSRINAGDDRDRIVDEVMGEFGSRLAGVEIDWDEVLRRAAHRVEDDKSGLLNDVVDKLGQAFGPLPEQIVADPEEAIRTLCEAMKDKDGVWTGGESEREFDPDDTDGSVIAHTTIEGDFSDLTGLPVKVVISNYNVEVVRDGIECDEPDYDDRDEGKITERRRVGPCHADVDAKGKFTATVKGKEIASGTFRLGGTAPATLGGDAYFDRSFGNWLPGEPDEVRTDEAEFNYLYIAFEPTGGC